MFYYYNSDYIPLTNSTKNKYKPQPNQEFCEVIIESPRDLNIIVGGSKYILKFVQNISNNSCTIRGSFDDPPIAGK